MKSILVDLHNHLLKNNDDFIEDKIIEKYLELRTKFDCLKIIAFTDHFTDQLKKLDDYKKIFNKLKNQESAKNNILLLGTEVDISFDENITRHLVIVFHNEFNDFVEFKEAIGKNEKLNFNEFEKNEKLFNFLNNNDKCFFFPHYGKSDKKRNFTIDELGKFNNLFNKNRINCLEIIPNLISYSFTKNDSRIKDYHILVSTDRYIENKFSTIYKKQDFKQNQLPIASYIYVNDMQSNDAYKIINDFLCQKNNISNISYDKDKDFTPPGIKYSFFLKNSIIFGNRGSGKTYLLNALKNALIWSDDQNRENEVCSIEQFEFSNKLDESLKTYLNKDYINKQNDKYNKLLNKILNNDFISQLRNEYGINSGDYKKDAKDYLKKFKDDFNLSIKENIDDKNNHLKNINKKYSFANQPLPAIPNAHFDQINEIINNLKKFIESLNNVKKDNYWKHLHTDIYESIKFLNKTLISKLLDAFSYEYKLKRIGEVNNEIFKNLNEKVKEINNWTYTFSKLNFANYFKLTRTIKIFDKFVDENASAYIKKFNNNNYSIKYELSDGKYKSPKLVYANDPNIEASSGQINEFLLNKKIFEDFANAKYFLFDEPEYAFDNEFIKNWSDKNIEKFKKCNNNVFVTTHNHIFWSEFYEQLNDKTYIKCTYDKINNNYLYEQFDETEFRDKYSFKNFEVDKDSYDHRKEKYNVK